MAASQDYRDGASTATHELRKRLIQGLDWGYPLTRESIEKVAEELCQEYGGRVEQPECEHDWPLSVASGDACLLGCGATRA